jgi:hypothetical protein
LLVWGTRISNILSDDGGTGALVVAGGLTALAVAGVASLLGARLAWAVPALAVATLVVWAVRVPLLLGNGHGAAFVVVHVVLAVVSAALAVGALRRSPRRSIRTAA